MATNIFFIALLSSVNIKNVYSYSTYGFYQGPNKVNKIKISQPTKNPSHQHSNINKQYVGNGFYQGPGPNKIEAPPQTAQNIPISKYQQTDGNAKYTGNGFSGYYQVPKLNQEKYITSGFYQGVKKVDPVPLKKTELANGFYQGPEPDNKNIIKKVNNFNYLQDDEKYMLKQIEHLFDDDVRIKLLMKLIKKIALS